MADRFNEELQQKAILVIENLESKLVEQISSSSIGPKSLSFLYSAIKAAGLNPESQNDWFLIEEAAKKSILGKTADIRRFSIDALINSGKEFYSGEEDRERNPIGLAVALKDAVSQMGSGGSIATMPYLIAGKAQADKENYLWNKWITAFSEEYAGIDKNGTLVRKGEAIVLTIHGGGILTANRIMQAYSEGLTLQNFAKLTETEFDKILNGILPSGESIDLYTVDDIKRGIPSPFGRYAVWMPADIVTSKPSGYHSKSDFMDNALVIARAGTLEYLDAYFEKAKHTLKNNVGNWHNFKEIDFYQPQGLVLFVGKDYLGLLGNDYLVNDGCFVGVAPGAQYTQKLQTRTAAFKNRV